LNQAGVFVVLHRRAAGKVRAALLVVFRIAERGLEELFLIDEIEQRLAGIGIVERRIQVIDPHDAEIAGLVQHLDLDVRVALQGVDQVDRRDLEEVDLAGLQRLQCGLRVRHVLVDDAVGP
jgi:hypothetical protein